MEKRIYIKTYGCQMNERESEGLGVLLQDCGYEIVSDEQIADIILLNMCSVREQAEAKAIGKSNLISRGKNQNKLIRIIGCMTQNLGGVIFQKSPHPRLIIDPNRLERIPEYLDLLIRDKNRRITDIEISSIDQQFAAAHDEKNQGVHVFIDYSGMQYALCELYRIENAASGKVSLDGTYCR
jgi:tRNA A37 methylthiotransferase MiaB